MLQSPPAWEAGIEILYPSVMYGSDNVASRMGGGD